MMLEKWFKEYIENGRSIYLLFIVGKRGKFVGVAKIKSSIKRFPFFVVFPQN